MTIATSTHPRQACIEFPLPLMSMTTILFPSPQVTDDTRISPSRDPRAGAHCSPLERPCKPNGRSAVLAGRGAVPAGTPVDSGTPRRADRTLPDHALGDSILNA